MQSLLFDTSIREKKQKPSLEKFLLKENCCGGMQSDE